MRNLLIILLSIIALAGFAVWATNAEAYGTYTGCQTCHGGFLNTPYISLADGQSWGNSLHNTHRNTMLEGDCDTCHYGSSKKPVYTYMSNGGVGFTPVGCVGCHGREEDNAGLATSGAGLRQHHYNAGKTICLGCHDDADPANYTPVSEDVLPPYYFTPDSMHSIKPTDSCNPSGEEDYAGLTIGLDNDGDGLYDTNDPDCQANVCIDKDGDGYGSNGSSLCPNGTPVDCDDNNSAVNPGAAELCDGLDNNCSGQIDEGVNITFYQDADVDGYGNPAVTKQGCTPPAGYVANKSDCNDTDPVERPSQTWYQDTDGDGYSKGDMIVQCSRPSGYKIASELISTSGECNDNNAAINPGAAEVCGNGVDENCDGADAVCPPVDSDGDGYDVTSDCNDNNAAINPGAAEVCGNGVDENCDGADAVCPPVEGHAKYEIEEFQSSERVRVGEKVIIRLEIKNQNDDKSDPGALLTIYGEQNGNIISITAGKAVFDTAGGEDTRYTFTFDMLVAGKIKWYAQLTDRNSPGITLDTASGETYVRGTIRRGDSDH